MSQVELGVRVTTRAAQDRVGPYADGLLQVRITRPPLDGEANRAVTATVARALHVPRSAVTLVAGARSRSKRVAIDGLTPQELAARLRAFGD